jgi:hypothetical protein
MGRLLLIRYAQASFLSQNYDKLSDLGEKQARLLGEYWKAHKVCCRIEATNGAVDVIAKVTSESD